MTYELTTLGEYAKVQGGYAYKSSDFKSHGNYPVLKIKNIRFGTVDYQDAAFISRELAEVTHEWKTQEGDILISMTGSGPNAPNSLVGRAARVWKSEPDAWINQRVGRLVLHKPEAIHPDVLFYALSLPSSQSYLVSNSSGSANQANISGKTIESLPCPRIDYEPSKVIAKILRNLDEKIILNRKTNETLEGMAQAIFKSWFVDFDPVKAKIAVLESGGSAEDARLAAMQAISGMSAEDLDTLRTQNEAAYAELKSTAEAFPSTFTDSPLGPIPEGWEVKTIGDCYKVIMGQSPSGETYNEKGQGTLFYQGRAEFGWRFPTPRLHTTDPKRMAEAGDVLLSVRAPVGDMNIAMHDCCVGRGLSALRHECGNTTFSYYQLNSIKSELDRFNGEGTVFGSINQKDLKNISVIAPSNPVLIKFIEKCSALDEIILSSSMETISLAETRDALLPKLLSGEIGVSSLGDE